MLAFLVGYLKKLFETSHYDSGYVTKRLWLSLPIHFHVWCGNVYSYVYGAGLLSLYINHESDIIRGVGAKSFGYLTVWNMTFQTVFLFLAFGHDVLEWTNKQDTLTARKIAYWRDVVFNSLVVPFTIIVLLKFWVFFWIDRDLIFPEIFETIVPWWYNHCVHTNIAIILLVETFLTPRRHSTNKSLELKIASLVTFGYPLVLYSIYFLTGRWLYNFYIIMTWWQVCLYQIVVWASTYVFYFMHFHINRLIHGSEEKTTATSKVQQPKKMIESSIIQKNGTEDSSFSSYNWHLKYKSLRNKIDISTL